MPKTSYYWNSERLEKLKMVCLKAKSWSEIYFMMKDEGEAISISSAKTVVSRRKIPTPNIKRGGHK